MTAFPYYLKFVLYYSFCGLRVSSTSRCSHRLPYPPIIWLPKYTTGTVFVPTGIKWVNRCTGTSTYSIPASASKFLAASQNRHFNLPITRLGTEGTGWCFLLSGIVVSSWIWIPHSFPSSLDGRLLRRELTRGQSLFSLIALSRRIFNSGWGGTCLKLKNARHCSSDQSRIGWPLDGSWELEYWMNLKWSRSFV